MITRSVKLNLFYGGSLTVEKLAEFVDACNALGVDQGETEVEYDSNDGYLVVSVEQ